MRMLIRAVAVMTCCVIPSLALAQGGIGGVVRDTSGAVLPGVTVEVSSPALIEQVRTAVTDSSGQYLVVDLRPGTYSATFSLAGFKSVRREGLALSAGVTLPINVELSVGELQETLTVTGASPVVDVQNVRRQTVLSAEVLENIARSHNAEFTAMLLPGVVPSVRDVGGSTGENNRALSIHGSRLIDHVMTVDGLWFRDFTATSGAQFSPVAESSVQEYQFGTGANSADIKTGGMLINVIPKEGGNVFRGSAYATGTTHDLTSDNLRDDLKTKFGLTKADGIDRIWDVNPSIGGPLLKNRMWFHTSYRNWGAHTLPVGAISETGQKPVLRNNFWSQNVRLTWQASPRNKLSGYFSTNGRSIPSFALSSTRTLEASINQTFPRNWATTAKWTAPLTSKWLLEAGFVHSDTRMDFVNNPASLPGALPRFELTTGIFSGATPAGAITNSLILEKHWGQTFSASYVTGSHAMKVGVQNYSGRRFNPGLVAPPLVTTRAGVPFTVTISALPKESRARLNYDLGLFAQDQWRVGRLTMNLGVRFDFLNEQIDAQNAPAGPFGVPARSFPEINDVPNWRDVSPRVGLAYDLFGHGRTAIKGSVSRYVVIETLSFPNSLNPLTAAAGTTDTRAVLSTNGSNNPEEWTLGPSTNRNFGLPVFSVRPDPALASGWGVRPYNREYSVSVQHQVFPGVAATIGYTRRAFGNLTWTNNTVLGQADRGNLGTNWTPFTITNPLSGEPITLYNLNPALRGQVNGVIQLSPDDSQVFDGLDLNVDGRVGAVIVNGGITMGRLATKTCTVSDPNALRFCEVTPGFFAQNQYKLIVAAPLPVYGVSVSGTFQGAPGPMITALYPVTSAIAGIPLTDNTIPVQLVPLGTDFGDRVNQLDLRVSKRVQAGRVRFEPHVEIFNALNAGPVLLFNTTFGPNWQKPAGTANSPAVLAGRFFKLGVQVEF